MSTSGNSAKEDLLGHATPQHHAHPVKQLLPRVQVLLFREVLRIAQTFPTWNNRNLTNISTSKTFSQLSCVKLQDDVDRAPQCSLNPNK